MSRGSRGARYLIGGRGRRALEAAVVALAAGLASAPATTASSFRYCSDQTAAFSGSHRFFGVTAWTDVAQADTQYRNCTFGRIAASHIGYVRFELDWSAVEAMPDQYDYSEYDAVMALLALHHLRGLPVVMAPPTFRAALPNETAGFSPPADDYQFADFVQLLVRRYGPGGTFWTTNPQLPYLPVRAWQIWNEPNLTVYWEPQASPKAYARLLIATSKAIRVVDPRALVVAGGVPFSALGYPAAKFVTALYRHGVKRYISAIAVHPYAPTALGSFQRVLAIRQVMNSFGDRNKAIWVTEFGWANSGPAAPYQVGRRQATRVARVLRMFERARRRLRLQELFYYDWRDVKVPSGSVNWWGLHTGLYAANSAPKRVARVVIRAAAKLNR